MIDTGHRVPPVVRYRAGRRACVAPAVRYRAGRR